MFYVSQFYVEKKILLLEMGGGDRGDWRLPAPSLTTAL